MTPRAEVSGRAGGSAGDGAAIGDSSRFGRSASVSIPGACRACHPLRSDRRASRSPSRRTIAPRRPSSRHESVALSARARRAARLRLALRRSGRRRPRRRSRASRRPGSAPRSSTTRSIAGSTCPATAMNQVGSARTLRYSSAVASTLTRQFWSLHSQTISIRSPSGTTPRARGSDRSPIGRAPRSSPPGTCERGIARDYRRRRCTIRRRPGSCTGRGSTSAARTACTGPAGRRRCGPDRCMPRAVLRAEPCPTGRSGGLQGRVDPTTGLRTAFPNQCAGRAGARPCSALSASHTSTPATSPAPPRTRSTTARSGAALWQRAERDLHVDVLEQRPRLERRHAAVTSIAESRIPDAATPGRTARRAHAATRPENDAPQNLLRRRSDAPILPPGSSGVNPDEPRQEPGRDGRPADPARSGQNGECTERAGSPTREETAVATTSKTRQAMSDEDLGTLMALINDATASS